MIEDHATLGIMIAASIPLMGAIYVWIRDHLPKYYYIHDGWRWKKKRYRR